ncbi:MAG: hypothetical protein KDA99_17360, partial [Planctomycetales bacterium]|nr:hypothetical protein [Planctomycetales bacterium]
MPLTTIWITDTGNSLMQSLRPTPMYIRRGRISAVGRRGTWVVLVRLCLLLAIGASILSGCAGLRLPAIDPTGNRIFLPAPSYTTLVDPADRPFLNPGSLFPEPAFPQPEDPPYCEDMVMVPAAPQVLVPAAPQAQSVVPANAVALEPFEDRERLIDRIRDQWSHRDLYDGKLSLTPARLVAPVGSEVVLRAEICLPDGYNVTREPIEWTLSQDSVGQFVEVDRSGKPLIHTLFHRRPKKVGSNFAIGTTATSSQLITRGTTREDDDIQLLPGQTWISLTSATEGASTVYAVAPRGCDWNNRRQAATIHWVDGQWTFPAPSVGVATAGQNLTTTVTRASNGSPIAGWIVRYEILDGPPAHFESSGNAIAEATSDSLGQATVRIIPDQQSAGTNRVGIQVIRTGSNSGDLARIAVGQGTTSVTWSATGLSVLMRAPDIAEVGSLIDYTIDVTNPSPLPLSDVEVNSAMATEL